MKQIDTLSFQLSADKAERLREQARQEECPVSVLIRRGVAHVLREQENSA